MKKPGKSFEGKLLKVEFLGEVSVGYNLTELTIKKGDSVGKARCLNLRDRSELEGLIGFKVRFREEIFEDQEVYQKLLVIDKGLHYLNEFKEIVFDPEVIRRIREGYD